MASETCERTTLTVTASTRDGSALQAPLVVTVFPEPPIVLYGEKIEKYVGRPFECPVTLQGTTADRFP